ncbi:MAG: hypothetical protein P0107_01975 [Nitrosomonas sp.]|nr:hypothetical protein [Nitrosomonas sp.]
MPSGGYRFWYFLNVYHHRALILIRDVLVDDAIIVGEHIYR